MTIQDVLKTYSGSAVRLMNWANNRWMLWNDDNSMWEIYESEDGKKIGKFVMATNNEETALKYFLVNTESFKRRF